MASQHVSYANQTGVANIFMGKGDLVMKDDAVTGPYPTQ